MLIIDNLSEAERFVNRQQRLGSNVRWDGWDIVFFREAPQAVYSAQGVIRDGRYGFDNRSNLTDKGTWQIDNRNIRRARHTPRH